MSRRGRFIVAVLISAVIASLLVYVIDTLIFERLLRS